MVRGATVAWWLAAGLAASGCDATTIQVDDETADAAADVDGGFGGMDVPEFPDPTVDADAGERTDAGGIDHPWN